MKGKQAQRTAPRTAAPESAGPRPAYSASLSAGGAFALPLVFVLGLWALAALPSVNQSPVLLASFRGAALLLAAWTVILFGVARRRQKFRLDVVLLRQHYLQACLQGTLILYWGYYWRQVYTAAPLIVAQLLFAYAFSCLLSWSRGRSYALGFGPFPVIFSITLFFWFKDQWFFLQFLMVAVGFAAKEFLRWQRDGRSAHIFNPSSFPLAVFSVLLLLTNNSDMTWGFLVANTEFYPPHMYLVIFLVGMPGQYLFGVTPMTMSAVVTTYLFSALYFLATGSFYFFDSHVPIAVFLGMHLLFTDPATAPRTELGRIFFGVLYGLSTVLLYDLLLRAGMPGFYDKLLQVPLLNLSVRALDRVAQSSILRRLDPSALGRMLAPRRRHLAYMSIWALAFAGMSSTRAVSDYHPGQWLPFWQQACAANARESCNNLLFLQEGFCMDGSGWACNEFAIVHAGQGLDRATAAAYFQRGCKLGYEPACDNASGVAASAAFRRSPPQLRDYPIVLRGSKGPISEREPSALYALACVQGWPGTCQAPAATRGAL